MLRQKYVSEGITPIIKKETKSHNHSVRKLDGTWTSAFKCCGYCMYYKHEGYIDEKLLKEHNCLGKMCDCYYERIKEQNDNNQSITKKEIKRKKEDILSYVNNYFYLNSYEGIKATGISDVGSCYEIRYAQICNCDEIIKIAKNEVMKTIGVIVSFININADFETQAQMIYG